MGLQESGSSNLIILSLFGGVMLLLYGVKVAGEGLQGYAGHRIKASLETMTRNRFAALFTGVFITFLLQTSAATSVTLVSLIESGLMTFNQTLGVLLGAYIGGTFTVQLISFKVDAYALFICGAGLLLMFIASDAPRRHAGEGIFGFGLIFLAMKLMSEALAPLQEVELFRRLLAEVGQNPLIGILIATALTALVQSSAATIGIVITLAMGDHPFIGITEAVPLILGANLGTTATAIISSVRGSTESKRCAFANLFCKGIGVVLLFPFLGGLSRAGWFESLGYDGPRQIANFHTLFNLALAAVLLPFINVIARRVIRWFPETLDEEQVFKPKYLNPTMLQTPSLALAQASRETLRAAEVVQDMLRLSREAILHCELELIARIERMDDKVDLLDEAIRFYLTQLSRARLAQEDAARQMEILMVISNIEAIGDVVDKNLMEYARKKAKECVQFSPEGQNDIEDLHALILENYELAISAFTTREPILADRVHGNKRRIRELEKKYYQKHIERLESGRSESFESSSIHLDVLTNLKRINGHITNIVGPLLRPFAPEEK